MKEVKNTHLGLFLSKKRQNHIFGSNKKQQIRPQPACWVQWKTLSQQFPLGEFMSLMSLLKFILYIKKKKTFGLK